MNKITVTTKSSDQIAADFDAVFRNIRPVQKAKSLTMADRLAPYRKAIMKQRRRGLSWAQIADGMEQPAINQKVSAKLLQKLYGTPRKPSPAVPTPRPRLFLDPVTGKPLPQPVA